ncbi:MAG: cell division protein FtsQ/DivIB, partial [Acidimicrobiales bacterium]
PRARTARAAPPRARTARAAPPRAERVTAMDPRIRARRAEVLRGEARRRLRIALGVLAVLSVAVGCWALLHSRMLSARVVTVVGAVHTPPSQIVAAAGLADHPPLIDVTGAAAAKVERLPWIAHAVVTREWPDGVRITVGERTPVAAVADGSSWALVARSGKVLERTSAPPQSLARVSSTDAPGAPGTSLGSARPALAVAATLPPAFRGQVTKVLEGARGNVTLDLTSGLTVNLGSTVQLQKKYEDVAAILSGAPLASGEVIDVAAPAAPIVTH